MKELSILEKLKEIANHSFVYGLGSVIQSALAILLVPLYTRQFSIAEFGVFSVCIIFGTLLGNLFSVGIASSLSRSYFDVDTTVHKQRVIGTSIILASLCVICQLSLGYVFSQYASLMLFKNNLYTSHVTLVLVWSALANFNNIFFVILRFQKLSKQVVTINLISLASSVIIIYLCVVIFNLGVKGALIGMCLNQAVLLFLLWFFSRGFLSLKFSLNEAKRQIAFGIPIACTTVSYFLIISMDRFVANEFLSLEQVGVYSLAVIIGSSVNLLFVMPFGQIWSPMRMQYRHDSNADVFYKIVLTYYFLIGFLVTVPVSVFSMEIIYLISGSAEYSEAWLVVPIVMTAYLVVGCVKIIDNGLYFARKVGYHAFVYAGCVVFNSIANIFLIPRFGYLFGALNLLLTFVIATLVISFFSNRIEPINFEGKRLLKIVGSFMVVMLTVRGLANLNVGFYTELVLKLSICSLFFVYVFFNILLQTERRSILASGLRLLNKGT
jgi:O-antigen/teichoic acid export membrane protein